MATSPRCDFRERKASTHSPSTPTPPSDANSNDSLVRAVEGAHFTGAGRAFCSGQDLDEAREAQSLSANELRARLELLQQITRRMRSIPKLLIAAINGPAVGFGVELTLACDARFASADAYFMFPELARGLYFTNATLELLPAFAGNAQACDLLLSGKRWSADEALAAGFVSRCSRHPNFCLRPAGLRNRPVVCRPSLSRRLLDFCARGRPRPSRLL